MPNFAVRLVLSLATVIIAAAQLQVPGYDLSQGCNP